MRMKMHKTFYLILLQKFNDDGETFRGILLKYPLPMSLHFAAAAGLG